MSEKCLICDPAWCASCWVYVVTDRAGDYPVKVGTSNHPTRRLSQHRKDRKRDLYIVHKVEFSCEYVATRVEALAIDELSRFRTRGDWFDCAPEIAVQVVCAASALVQR